MAEDEKQNVNNNGLFDRSFNNVIGDKDLKANYEKQSLKIILSLIECSTSLKNNKTRISRLMVERLDSFIEQLNRLNTCSTSELKVKQDIRAIQINIANYVIKSDKSEIRKLKQNLKKLNDDNKQLLQRSQKSNDLQVEENNKLNAIINSNQEKLHGIVKSTMNNEVAKFFDDLKPVNLEKLDFHYRMLYESIERGNNKEISERRKNLINCLKLNKDGLKKNYEYVRVIDEINALLNRPSSIEEKQVNIKSLLARKGNKDFENYFGDSVDNYIDFKKRFRNLYDYLDVKRLKLYNGALENELQKQRETLKYRYSEEVLTAKIGPIKTFKIGWPIIIELIKNTIGERKEAHTFRKKWDKVKQEFKDIGRILGLPFVSVYKLFVKIFQEGIWSIILSIVFFFSRFSKGKKKKDKKEQKKEKKEAKKRKKEDEKKIKEELNKSNEVILNRKRELVKDYNVSEGLRADFKEALSDVNYSADKAKERMEENKKENKDMFREAFDSLSLKESNKNFDLPSGKVVIDDSEGIDRTFTVDDISYSYKSDDTIRFSIIDKNNNSASVIEQGKDGKVTKVNFTILEDGELKQIGELEDVTDKYIFDNESIKEDLIIPCLTDKEGNYIAGSIEEEYTQMLSKNLDESVVKK